MISEWLESRLACPVCLERAGCPRCSVASEASCCCDQDYARRVACACGGPEKVRLVRHQDGWQCPCCQHVYRPADGGASLALVPPAAVCAVTQYADHEFHERLGVKDTPPVLSAGIKAGMMLRMTRPGVGDHVLDLGCGAGKFALHTATTGAQVVGADIAPFFLPRAERLLDLVQCDLRRLPFLKGSFDAGYSLDVLEHLDEPGVVEVLVEARRVLRPSGRLFVYTHAMESSRLARFQRWVNRFAGWLDGWGLVDQKRELMRKSDHVNAIRSHEHFEALSAGAGLRVVQRRYYNVVFKALVEDLLLRMVERARMRKTRSGPGIESASTTRHGSPAGGAPPGRLELAVARLLTLLLWLDVRLFGGIRTGPFFGLLRPATPIEREERPS